MSISASSPGAASRSLMRKQSTAGSLESRLNRASLVNRLQRSASRRPSLLDHMTGPDILRAGREDIFFDKTPHFEIAVEAVGSEKEGGDDEVKRRPSFLWGGTEAGSDMAKAIGAAAGAAGAVAETMPARLTRKLSARSRRTSDMFKNFGGASNFEVGSFEMAMRAAKKYKIVRERNLPTDDDLRSLHALCASPIVSCDYLARSIAVNPAGPGQTRRGFLPLHHLASNPHASGKMIALLVKADPRAVAAKDEMRRTPLQWLCSSSGVDAVGLSSMVKATVPVVNPDGGGTVHSWVGLEACLTLDGNHRLPLHALCENGFLNDVQRDQFLRILLFHDQVDNQPIIVRELKKLGLDLSATQVPSPRVSPRVIVNTAPTPRGPDVEKEEAAASMKAMQAAHTFWTMQPNKEGDVDQDYLGNPVVHHRTPGVYQTAGYQRRCSLVKRDTHKFLGLRQYIDNLSAMCATKGAWGSLSPLHVLCANGRSSNYALYRLVMSAPDAITQMDSMGRLPLHHLCDRIPCPSAAEVMTLLGASPSTGMVRDLRGNTALHYLCVSQVCNLAVFETQVASGEEEVFAQLTKRAKAAHADVDGASFAKRFFIAIKAYIELCPQSCMETTRDGRMPLHLLSANNSIYVTPAVAGRVEARKKSRQSRHILLYRLRTGLTSGPSRDVEGGDLPLTTAPIVSPPLIALMHQAAPEVAYMTDGNNMTPVDCLMENGAFIFHSTGGPRPYLDQIGITGFGYHPLLPRYVQRAIAWVRVTYDTVVLKVRGEEEESNASGDIPSGVTRRRRTRQARILSKEAKKKSIDEMMRRSDFVTHSYEEACASQLHEIWKESRRLGEEARAQRRKEGLPPLEFNPRIKTVGNTLYDIANLDFWELPATFRTANIRAANHSCKLVREASKAGTPLDEAFLEFAAEEAHILWLSIPANRGYATEVQLRDYKDMTQEEKDKDRVIIAASINVWYDRGHAKTGAKVPSIISKKKLESARKSVMNPKIARIVTEENVQRQQLTKVDYCQRRPSMSDPLETHEARASAVSGRRQSYIGPTVAEKAALAQP